MNAHTSRKRVPVSAGNDGARALKVGGVTPFSATDYPGQLSAVIFVQGCPWRCGYCHNRHLQERPQKGPVHWPRITDWLAGRAGLVDAVVFSGGEPTMDPALPDAIAQVRTLGFKIGLHTACIYPGRLAEVLPLVDWVGFDIKAPFADYARVTQVADSGKAARECAALIVASGVAHECRTTVHPSLQSEDELLALASELAAMGVQDYALQMFRPQGCIDQSLNGMVARAYPSAETVRQISALFPRFTMRKNS